MISFERQLWLLCIREAWPPTRPWLFWVERPLGSLSVEMHREGSLPPYAYLALGWHSQSCLTADKLLDHKRVKTSQYLGLLLGTTNASLFCVDLEKMAVIFIDYFKYIRAFLQSGWKQRDFLSNRLAIPLQTLVCMGALTPWSSAGHQASFSVSVI